MRSWERYTETKSSLRAKLPGTLLFCLLSTFAPRVLAAQASDPRPAQTPTSAGVIRGTVTLTDPQSQTKPLAGVRVELNQAPADSLPQTTTTDSDGHYQFANVSPGAYTLAINQPGLKPFSKPVALGCRAANIEDLTPT